MDIVASINRLIESIRRRHRYQRTERLLSGMPHEVLKDIGWPGSREGLDARSRPRRPA